MSDDFDKEAERKRLREKYEEEQQQNETTERMSELLLKGATMTNAHCGECGDPIFRYEGQEFCPSCQTVVTEADQTGAAQPKQNGEQDEAEAGETAEAADAAETADAGEQQPAQTEAVEDAEQVEATEETAQTDEPAEHPDLPDRREETLPDRERGPSDELKRPDPPAVRREADEQVSQTHSAESNLSAARESLERTLLRFAREAEHTEDPRRAKEHLEAANEAADTLATMSEIR